MSVNQKAFTTCTSRVVPLLQDHVDTDQIIPARYLKVTERDGLADALFADWRTEPDFVLNQTEHAQSAILLAGENFGCGSSREHAPWALTAWGFRVIIARSFADIFKNNALKNALVPVALSASEYEVVRRHVEAQPEVRVTVDLRTCQVILPNVAPLHFSVDGFARDNLLQGIDPLDYLFQLEPEIARFEAHHG